MFCPHFQHPASLFKYMWLLYVSKFPSFCPHSIFMCFSWISEKNSYYFPIQHKLTGFYNPGEVCLLRGTEWVFIYNSV